MNRSLLIVILVIALILVSGCTQSRPAQVPQPDTTAPVPALTQAAPPVAPETSAPAAAATSVPVETVTIIHYIEEEKAWQDTALHVALRAPASWKLTTRQLDLPEGSQGLEYQTDLVPGGKFYIRTFPISRNQDQDYRNQFRKWMPAPAESTVTYNNIVYDRFESANNGETRVGYVARKSSANDLGFSSVIFFLADDAKVFEKVDYEKVAQSFSYLTKETAKTASGTEIPRVR